MSKDDKEKLEKYQKNYREAKKLSFLVKQYIIFFIFMDLVAYASAFMYFRLA